MRLALTGRRGWSLTLAVALVLLGAGQLAGCATAQRGAGRDTPPAPTTAARGLPTSLEEYAQPDAQPPPSALFGPVAESEALTIVTMDVGQGDSFLILPPGQRSILVDAGTSESAGPIARELLRHGVEQIDLFLATHPHEDHIGGFVSLLRRFPVRHVVDTFYPQPGPLYRSFQKEIKRHGAIVSHAQRGMVIQVDGDEMGIYQPPDPDGTARGLLFKGGDTPLDVRVRLPRDWASRVAPWPIPDVTAGGATQGMPTPALLPAPPVQAAGTAPRQPVQVAVAPEPSPAATPEPAGQPVAAAGRPTPRPAPRPRPLAPAAPPRNEAPPLPASPLPQPDALAQPAPPPAAGPSAPVVQGQAIKMTPVSSPPLTGGPGAGWWAIGAPPPRVAATLELPLFDPGRGVVLQLLLPDKPWIRGSRSDVNANSVVFKLTYHGQCMVFMGDAEADTEDRLVTQAPHPDLHCPVLKVAHHGSGHSSTERVLDEVQPQVALISAGRFNRYGHPSPQTIQKLMKRGAWVFRTDKMGTVTLRTDGSHLQVDIERTADFWQRYFSRKAKQKP